MAIDGKQLRRSQDRAAGKSTIEMVSAWAEENRLVLGQVRVAEKSNEITAVPELLKVLEISGCILTLDAMGCQTEIAKAICDKQADYVLAVKGNQSNLLEDLKEYFAWALADKFQQTSYPKNETVEALLIAK